MTAVLSPWASSSLSVFFLHHLAFSSCLLFHPGGDGKTTQQPLTFDLNEISIADIDGQYTDNKGLWLLSSS